MRDYTISYAQNREDVLLDAFFPHLDDGFYVDVGANHPEIDSVTKLFYDKGWRGINIEPTKSLFAMLQTSRPEDINLNIGISNKKGKLSFREYQGGEHGLSTFSENMKQTYTKSGNVAQKFRDHTVSVKTLAAVFAEQKVSTIHFMKVDVEGYEYEVLEGNDWEKYRPQLICIESNHMMRDWHPLLKRAKYEQVFFDGLNEYFLAKEHPEIAKRFSYVEGLIGKPIMSLTLSNEIAQQNDLNRKLENDRLRLNQRLQQQEKQIYDLSQALERYSHTWQQLGLLARSIDAAILRRILKLDAPKPHIANRKLVIPHLPPKAASRQRLLAEARSSDLDNFYATKNRHVRSPRHLFFVLILQSYNVCRALGKEMVKGLLKLRHKLRSTNV